MHLKFVLVLFTIDLLFVFVSSVLSVVINRSAGFLNSNAACNKNRQHRIVPTNVFFGSSVNILNDNQYAWDAELHEYYKKVKAGEIEDNTDLPLAPEIEDEEVPDLVEDVKLGAVPSCKKEWSLRKRAQGRRFWHHFFASYGTRYQSTHRWMKYQHDRFFCNRVLHRKITEVHPLIDKKNPDGTIRQLTPKQIRQQKNRFRIERTIVGYDNSGITSNILMILNMSQKQLVERVEKVRLPGLLDLRNFEILRLLEDTMVYLTTYNNFRNAMDFLLCFGRFNPEFEGEIKNFCTLEPKPMKRLRPVIFAVIGKLRRNPFAEKLLLTRRKKAPPLRERFPDSGNDNSRFSQFLDCCQSLILHELKDAEYDHNETTLRDFSDSFKDVPEYTTKGSVNKIDCPRVIRFQEMLQPYLRDKPGPEATEDEIDTYKYSCLTPDDVKSMLKVYKRLGRVSPETLIERIRSLHQDIGFSYAEIVRLVKTYPVILKFGGYKNHCLAIYDCDESFTFDDILKMVKSYPALLTVNIQRTIRPKIYYFFRNVRQSLKELLEFPKYLSFSLYERIIPRHFAIMNRHYQGKFLKVFKYLFCTGYYNGYGQKVVDPKVPDLLPKSHAEQLEAYTQISSKIDIKSMLKSSDDAFCQIFNLSYRDLAIGKKYAYSIPFPSDVV
ncbi:bifunctional Transcription termination factor [Babesia duncani]|uniref:Bifunctional Transcription termination factor n=1 Tax=Babesia duncani TaxID=323732 RepID=A0AAD9PL01_9APIC|nr:bifunctional Transcription termination factor [Babesia duncani]